MKKFRWSIAALVLCAALAFAACGVDTQPPQPETIAGKSGYTLTLSEREIAGFANEQTFLPVPAAKDESGADVTGRVRVEVLFADGRVYSPEHRYALYDSFVANEAGDYFAVYTVADEEGTVRARAAASVAIGEAPADVSVKVDGVLDDAAYSLMPAYRTGVNGALTFKYHFADEGVYLAAQVRDTQLIYSDYVVSHFTQSDGFEIFMNLSDEEGDMLNESCFKLQVNVNGLVRVYGASEGGAAFEQNEAIAAEYKLQVNGTKTEVSDENALSYYDTDAGYTFEGYFSYAQLGVGRVPDAVGVAFRHRDVSSADPSLINDGGQANRVFADVALPGNVAQIIHDNGKTYEWETYDAYAVTALYNTLYLRGEHKGVAVPQAESAVTVDGAADEAVWADAEAFSFGEEKVSVKAFTDRSGLYVFAEVTDASVAAGTNGSIFGGDCVQLRVAAGEALASDSLLAGIRKDGRVLTAAADGRTEKSCLNPASLLFVGGFDAATAVIKTDTGYAAEFFIPAYALGIAEGDAIGICVGVIDAEEGVPASVSDFIYSSACDIPSGYRIIGG